MERICRLCRLFDNKNSVCTVNVIISGTSYELPVLANDPCHWERVDREVNSMLENEIEYVKLSMDKTEQVYFQAKLEAERDHIIEVKQIRMWSDGKDGYIETQE